MRDLFLKKLFNYSAMVLLAVCCSLSINTKTQANNTEFTHLQSILPDHCRFAGTFTQSKNLSGLPIPLRSSGLFLFDCKLGLIWHTQQPVSETRVYTQQDLHFQVDKNDEIENKDNIIQLYIADLLLGIMSADQAFIADHFSVTTTGLDDAEPFDAQKGITLRPSSTFLQKGLKSITLQKTAQQLTLSLFDKKNQATLINSIETKRYTSQQQSIKACSTLFPTGSACAVLTDPSAYAELGDTSSN